MIKVMTVFGTRPEAIKMAPLVKELKSRKEIECIVCVTAQHRQMLDQVLEVFDIKPDYDLDIMKQGQTLSDITSRVLYGLENVIKEVKPDIVLVHGDTTTTFAGALAAYYNQVDIGHVEAGLRTWNKYSPYPEEMNRQMVGVLADMHFAPTENSKKSLLKENKDETKIYVTGNTAIDALATTVKEDYTHPIFDWVGNDRMILLTAHRRENLGEPMRGMFKAIKRITDEFSDFKNTSLLLSNSLASNTSVLHIFFKFSANLFSTLLFGTRNTLFFINNCNSGIIFFFSDFSIAKSGKINNFLPMLL